jgi:2-polyprenyl-6-methoxyphenol hydroxylase-like FAD-dependent oxidoreductase
MQKENPKSLYKKYDDSNTRVYRTIPLYFDKDSKPELRKRPTDLNYSLRTNMDINLDALPSKEGGYVAVVLFRPWEQKIKSLKNAADARKFWDKTFPMFSSCVQDEDLARFAARNDSKLPYFSYTGGNLHKGKSTVLLGDAIHTVKPYFGQGVNSAFEDVMTLDAALASCKDNIPQAVKKYSDMRAKDAKALVEISRSLDGGFVTFVLPLLLDSLFNKFVPKLIAPNMIRMMQDETKSFSQIQRRKRLDRLTQVITFGSAGYGMFRGVKYVAMFALKTMRKFVRI